MYNDTHSDQAKILINYFSYFSFYQHNLTNNYSGSQLDLVFFNDINTNVYILFITNLVSIDKHDQIKKKFKYNK